MQGNFVTGIYKITNKVNGKVYIGQGKNITRRWHEHVKALSGGRHHSYKLQKDYEEFGIENFIFEVIEKCSIDLLDTRELLNIDKYNSVNKGYNIKGDMDEYKLDYIDHISGKFVIDIDGLIQTGIKPSTLFRYIYFYTRIIGHDGEIQKPLHIKKVKDMSKYMNLKDRTYRSFIYELRELDLITINSQDDFYFSNEYIKKVKYLNVKVPEDHIIVYKDAIKEVYESVTLDRHKLFSSIFYVHELFKENKCDYKDMFNFLLPISCEPVRNMSVWKSATINGIPTFKCDKEMCSLNSFMYHRGDVLGNKSNIDSEFIASDDILMNRK